MKRLLTLIKNLFKIAKLLSVDDSGDLRFGSVSMLGKNQKILLFSPYGLMHKPPSNSLTLVWSQQGQESNAIGMADDPKNRTLKNLKPGEVALGNYLTEHYIFFDENGKCTLITDDLDILVTENCNIEAKNMSIDVQEDLDLAANNVTIEATADLTLIASDTEITSTTLTHNGTNIGDDHSHPQGLDSGGNVEQNTGGPL